MTDHAIGTPAEAARRRPRRRWSDVNPLGAAALVASIFALLFHVMPGDDASHAIRVVLTGISLVTASMLVVLLMVGRIGRSASGHSINNHPGRRAGDRRRG